MMSKILIPIIVFTSLLFPQQDFRIIASNQSSIIIEYNPQFADTSIIKIDGQEFRNISLVFGYVDELTQIGTPEVPERRFTIGVPSEFGNSIKVLSSSYKLINGKVLPVPLFEKESFLNGVKYEISPEYFNYTDFPELASFGDFGIVRGLQVQKIRLFPVKFDVNSNCNQVIFQNCISD